MNTFLREQAHYYVLKGLITLLHSYYAENDRKYKYANQFVPQSPFVIKSETKPELHQPQSHLFLRCRQQFA